MAKAQLNPVMEQIRGAIGDLVFRHREGQVVISRRVDLSDREPTLGQIAVRERFRLAALYATGALADPGLRAFYEGLAASRKAVPRVLAMTDYLRPPEVLGIDAAGYGGAIGEVIVVNAVDDAGVVGVQVTLRDGDGLLLEQGAATAALGRWSYTATTAVAAGTVVTVEAVATDRAAQSGSKTLTVTL